MDVTNTQTMPSWLTKVTPRFNIHIPDKVAVPAEPGDFVRLRVTSVYDSTMDRKQVEPFEVVGVVQANKNVSLTKKVAGEKGIVFGDRVRVEFLEKKVL